MHGLLVARSSTRDNTRTIKTCSYPRLAPGSDQTQQALEHVAIISARHFDTKTRTMKRNALEDQAEDGARDKGYSLLFSATGRPDRPLPGELRSAVPRLPC